MNIDTAGKKAGAMAAILGLLGIIYGGMFAVGVAPYTNGEAAQLQTQVQSNTDALLLQRWQYLNTKLINQGLDPQEQYEYCAISNELGFVGTGCA